MITEKVNNRQQQRIFYHYQSIDFSTLKHGIISRSYSGSKEFIHGDNFYFDDYVGLYYLTGNELMHYPALATELQKINDYPLMVREYPIVASKSKKGATEFFMAFALEVEHNTVKFQQEKSLLDSRVNNLIYLYGQQAQTPIYQGLQIIDEEERSTKRFIKISGVEYRIREYRYMQHVENIKETHYIDIYRLTDTKDGEVVSMKVTNGIINTPFIQIHFIKSYGNKGHLKWIDLRTGQFLKRDEVFKSAIKQFKIKLFDLEGLK